VKRGSAAAAPAGSRSTPVSAASAASGPLSSSRNDRSNDRSPIATCTCGIPAASAASREETSAGSRTTSSGRQESTRAVTAGHAASGSRRPNTSVTTRVFAS